MRDKEEEYAASHFNDHLLRMDVFDVVLRVANLAEQRYHCASMADAYYCNGENV